MALVARNMPHASHTRQSVYRCAPTLTTLHIPHRPAPLALSNATRSAARLSYASALPLSPSAILSEIVDRVYVSDLSCAEDPAQLAAYGITHILSAMPLARTPAAHLSRTRMVVPLQDTPFAELAAFLPSTTAFIVNALRSSPNARVLVHCQMGASRSVSVTAAYLIASRGFSPAEAIAHIKERRAVAAPNWGFVNQLEEYARTLEVDADGSDDETEAH